MLGLWKRLSLQTKIVFLFITVNVLILTTYTVFAVRSQTAEKIQAIDAGLILAAHKYIVALGEENLDRAFGNNMPEDEYKTIVASMGKYAESLNLAYLYSITVADSKTKYVFDGCPQEDIDKGEFSLPWEDYEDASPKIAEAWNAWTPQFDEYTDKFGHFRSYFLPLTTRSGNKVILCADMGITDVQAKIRNIYISQISQALGILVFSFVLSFVFARMIAKSILDIGSRINYIAGKRDFTKNVAVKSSDEIGKMAESLNSLQSVLKQAIGQAYDISVANVSYAENFSAAAASIQGQVASSSRQVEQLNEDAGDINKHAQLAANHANSVRLDIDKIDKELADECLTLRGLVEGVKKSAQNSRALANDLQELNTKVVAIGRVLEIVADISEQTNILAINASIEAAHAGDIGRGFAVVADQVRNLASNTQQTVGESEEIVKLITQGISNIIAKMAETVEVDEKLAQASGKSLAGIESMQARFADTTSMMAESAAGSDSINSSIAHMTGGLGDVNSALESSKSQADEILHTASSILDSANDLKKHLSGFKVK